MHAQRLIVVSIVSIVAAALPATAIAQQAYSLSGTRLISYSIDAPQVIQRDIPIASITAGESVIGIDMRPQNGLLYALGVNATANTATLYLLSSQTGLATVVGTASSIAFVDAVGNPVDFADPATTGWGFDINPAADRVRVVSGGLNFRIDPNSGSPIDGNLGGAVLAGTNPDGPINGGTTSVDATAYTNNRPNGGITTQYTLDATSNSLYLQNPPNSGLQTLAAAVTLGGLALDFTSINGFDIPSSVSAPAANTPAPGNALAVLSVAGTTSLFRIDLTTGASTNAGSIGGGGQAVQGFTLQQSVGVPAIGLNLTGTNLVRFSINTPFSTATQAIGAITAGESLVAIDFRPQTGQLYGLGINATANNGTVYRIDPQTGGVQSIGAAGGVAFVDGGAVAIDLPDPATVDYGFDFNPTVDRIRVTAGSNLNFRINPITGAPVDGDAMVPGIQPDVAIQGAGSTGVEAAAYTNSFGQLPDSNAVTTLYTLDAVQNTLFIQNPANGGTQTTGQIVRLNGATLDFTSLAGFDIPASVRVTASGLPAQGNGYAALNVGGLTGIYAIDLATAQATLLGTVASGLRGITLAETSLDIFRDGFE